MATATLAQVKDKVVEFLETTLEKRGRPIRVVAVKKQDGEWQARVEVVEESEYVKSLGRGATVWDRNTYRIRLNGELEVTSFELQPQHPVEEFEEEL